MPVDTERGYRVTLSFGQRRVIWMLAKNGKEVDMDLGQLNKHAQDGITDLEVKGLVRITTIVGSPKKHLYLTDLGVQVAEQLEKLA